MPIDTLTRPIPEAESDPLTPYVLGYVDAQASSEIERRAITEPTLHPAEVTIWARDFGMSVEEFSEEYLAGAAKGADDYSNDIIR